MCVCVFSLVQLFVTPWTVACQAPLSLGFSRQEYWIRLPFPSPGNLLDDARMKPGSPSLAGGFFTTSASWGKKGNSSQVYFSLCNRKKVDGEIEVTFEVLL